MAANGQTMAEIDFQAVAYNPYLQKYAYVTHEGFAEKYTFDHLSHEAYHIHTPSGIKKVKYDDIKVYIPDEVYKTYEQKEKSRAADYKERKVLERYEYDHLVKYFPDEKEKWSKATERTMEMGHFGGIQDFVTTVYKRASQGGGRRKQSRKNKRTSRSTRRR
jgi:hypothetical protein